MRLDGNSLNGKNLLIIKNLQNEIARIVGPLTNCKRVTVVEFPDVFNAGDSAIWMGQMEYFGKRIGSKNIQVSKKNISRNLIESFNSEIICICGGGNFGDIWPNIQINRESLINEYRDYKILQLPQSIHYGDESKIQSMAKAVARHGNVALLFRDRPSLELARKHFDCPSELCPDMAFMIGPIGRTCRPSLDVLGILRKDREAIAGLTADGSARSIQREDWQEDVPSLLAFAKWSALARNPLTVVRPSFSLDRDAGRKLIYESYARLRFMGAVRQLSRARTVVTDRLHAHIICVLMGIPHAVLDNNYGKIAGFMDAFGTDQADVHVASSYSDAVDWASERAAANRD